MVKLLFSVGIYNIRTFPKIIKIKYLNADSVGVDVSNWHQVRFFNFESDNCDKMSQELVDVDGSLLEGVSSLNYLKSRTFHSCVEGRTNIENGPHN